LAATGQVQDLTLPVLDLSAPVQPLVFTEGTADGALVAIGTQDIRLAADVLFAFDRADLTPRARQLLDDAAARVRAAKATRLAVTGFTDSVGTPSYNLALSRRRADAVAAALRTRLGTGVAVSATGAGETRPIADNATKAGQALNRRVEVRAS
jgi:outer membrane protein OmpA-like peptidoglycan-associated protein